MLGRSGREWGLRIIIFLVVISFYVPVTWGSNVVGPEEKVSPISYSEIIIHPDEMAEDLDFIVQTLKDVHPVLEFKENRRVFNELATLSHEKIQEPMSRQEFYLIANQLVNFFGDAQTHLWFPHEDRYLPLKLRWVSDGIVVTDVLDSSLPIAVGDELIAVGDLRSGHLLDRLRNLIPNENDHRIRALGGSHLAAGFILQGLGVLNAEGDVEMTFSKANGEEYSLQIPCKLGESAQVMGEILSLEKEPWYGWYIKKDKGYAHFWLDVCKSSLEFNKDLERFFSEVQTAQVRNVVIDLRNNPGGDVHVIEDFLAYFPPEVIQYPISKVRYSKQAKENEGYSSFVHFFMNVFQKVWGGEKSVLKQKNRKLGFDGNLYVLTSNQTFGEASMFATILKDNGLAMTIGESTGSAPSSYGDQLHFETPNLKFYLTVSYKSFTRPNIARDQDNTLQPDYRVETTVQDLRLGRDPQIEWLENYLMRLNWKKKGHH